MGKLSSSPVATPECDQVLTVLLLAVLRNDQDALTEELDQLLQEYFAAASSSQRPKLNDATRASREPVLQTMDLEHADGVSPHPAPPKRPFAMGNVVQPLSICGGK